MTQGGKTSSEILRDPVLLGCLVCALTLRLYGIDRESLWFDEIFSIRLASGSLRDALSAEANNPPLHFVLLHFWMSWFGTSAASARALSVIPSVLTIGASYLLTLRLFDRATARLTAIFLCLSSFQIYYAQEARTFSLFLFFLTLSFVFLERILFGEGLRRDWIGYIITTIISFYSHFYAVFFVAAHSVLYLALWKKTRPHFWRWAATQSAIGVAFLPWLITMLGAASAGGQERKHLLLKLPQSFFSFLAGDTLIPLDERAVQAIIPTLVSHAPALAATVLGFGFFGFMLPQLRRGNGHALLFCAILTLVPVLIPFLISFQLMLFEERYLIGVTVPLIIALSASAVLTYRTQRLRRLSALAVGLVLGVTSLSLYNYFFDPRFGRDEWREATAYIDQVREESDVVLFQPDYVAICYEYYSTRPAIKRYLIFDDVLDRLAPDSALMYSALETAPRVILVRSNYRDESFLTALRKQFDISSERRFEKDKGLSVYIMQARFNSTPSL